VRRGEISIKKSNGRVEGGRRKRTKGQLISRLHRGGKASREENGGQTSLDQRDREKVSGEEAKPNFGDTKNGFSSHSISVRMGGSERNEGQKKKKKNASPIALWKE